MDTSPLRTSFACLALLAFVAQWSAPAEAQTPTLATTAVTVPEEVPAAATAALADGSLTLTLNDAPVMNLWLTAEAPAAAAAGTGGQLEYATLPVGTFVGVMQLLRPHIDYRDQLAPVGVYALRYLQQPVDGNHIGVTIFRDFLVLTPLETAADLTALSSEEALAAALLLNTHPFTWGLWPANEVPVQEVPGLASVDGNKWALEVEIPRAEGAPLRLALVVIGSEPPDSFGSR